MRRFAIIFFFLMSFVACSTVVGAENLGAENPIRNHRLLASPFITDGSVIILNYHEVRDEVRDYPDPYAVDSALLVRQFEWLRGNGYVPVSLDQVIQARQGGKPLPTKAVLLTFDDAYNSFYTRVYPLLLDFNFPAVLGVVGQWIDKPPSGVTPYGEKSSVPVASFPSWNQLREMADSGLVELASHTYNLHRGLVANPQGNLEPAATTNAYNQRSQSYESERDWEARVRTDLKHSSEVIEQNTGYRPRVIVWPYGSYNNKLVDIAADLGMYIDLTLDDGANPPDVSLTALRRILIENNPSLADFVENVRGPIFQEPIRVVQVDLDDIYSANPAQQEQNLSILLDRIKELRPSHVYLRATTDTNGDGIADAAYFPNRNLPMRSDIFNRVAWQLSTRGDVSVYAVMPVNSFHLPQKKVIEVYEDLARHADFSGLVFDIQSHPTDDRKILKFTQELATHSRKFRAPLKTVRTVYVAPSDLLIKTSISRFTELSSNYDQVALMINSNSKNTDFRVWLKTLTGSGHLARDERFQRKGIVMLRNLSSGNSRDDSLLVSRMRMLQLNGVLNFGYMPDDFLHDTPPLAEMAPVMSLRMYLDKKINAH